MAAFDPIKSGFTGLDAVLDNIRLGDNVVWRVTAVEDFAPFATALMEQAIADSRKMVYIRFAQHPPFADRREGLKVFTIDPAQGFEAFTVAVHAIITHVGRDAFYIFDCLSELQEAWSTDLMMGNFFRVTCPYLFALDTVAYFPIIRGMHSFDAVDRIRQTTQLLLDIYRSGEELYLTPVKVWNRYSGEMFLPHLCNSTFEALTDGVALSRYYAAVDAADMTAEQKLDSWDRMFAYFRMQFAQGMLSDDSCMVLCRLMMTRDKRMTELIGRYFTARDYFLIRDRMIGTGRIGGKASGMLLARKIVQNECATLGSLIEPHDSYYIGSDVFYTYIVYNDCWSLRIRQRAERERFDTAEELGDRLRNGSFPEDIRQQFRRMLDYFGQSPIIVRSSSFLEDGFGNAFAGKYESVFCTGTGDVDTRLREFEQAVRTVYASTMSASALEYRRCRGLLGKDEQMAILVQRVSGSRFGNAFMPTAAGVGYSYNAYCWAEGGKPENGMLRLVMGLGTRAVDRTEGDYPRIVALDRPLAITASSMKERHRFSQHSVDYIDLQKGQFASAAPQVLEKELPHWCKNLVLSHDTEAELFARNRGMFQSVLFADCQGLAGNPQFIDAMRKILSTLEAQYKMPVDIEFTLNGSKSGEFVINLLQCRPIQKSTMDSVNLPEKTDNPVLFELLNSAMGSSCREKIDIVVYVDPHRYYECPYSRKPNVARAIGTINAFYRDLGKSLLLIVPGRIGTSSPELGVPVVYSEMSMFRGVCEVAYSAAGYMPELSYGSHMFQDFVESNIFYGAIFEDSRQYHPEYLFDCPEISDTILAGDYDSVLSVFDVSRSGLTLAFDMMGRRALCCFEKSQANGLR